MPRCFTHGYYPCSFNGAWSTSKKRMSRSLHGSAWTVHVHAMSRKLEKKLAISSTAPGKNPWGCFTLYIAKIRLPLDKKVKRCYNNILEYIDIISWRWAQWKSKL